MSPCRIALLAATISLASGCTALQAPPPERGDDAIARLGADGTPPPIARTEPVPDALARLLAPPETELAPVVDDDVRFDVAADGVPVREFFHGLVEGTPWNVLVHPELVGTVTLSLRDVTVPEVMALLRDGHDLHSRREGRTFVVLPARLESRLFRLDYLDLDRTGATGTRISAGDLANGGGRGGNGAGGGGAGGGAANNATSGSTLRTSSRSALWEDLEALVGRLLESEAEIGASVVTSPDAGALVVRATPATLDRIDAFVQQLDATLNRQVILEARILEVSLDDSLNAGIDWNFVGNDAPRAGERALLGSVAQGGALRPEAQDVFSISLSRPDAFEATISALETQGDVQVLSAPRISTLNNQKALIKVGTDAYFQTDVQLQNQVFQGGVLTQVQPEFSPFFSGIALDVTPNISADGWITLHVQPSVTTVAEVQRSLDSGGSPVTFSLASSEVRQSDSIVRARDGELVVIGGLMQEREVERDARVPLLGRLPLLGWLGANTQRETRNVELVILLRPRVVGDGDWAREVDARSRRLESLYGDGP